MKTMKYRIQETEKHKQSTQEGGVEENYNLRDRIKELERHKVVLDCYAKTLKYTDENDTTRTTQGIQKPVSVRQVLAMQFKKCMRKGCQVYAIQVTNLLEK
jgi:hypothetical protein